MSYEPNTRVTVVDIQMPFWSMVVFMVKAAIASIPAVFILTVIASVFMAILSALFGSGLR
ncbi:hypothetical protein [Allochromatium vinosum]|jgi:hypothetical protein|uniref:Uncharacterized protein n=1 Tax=Allochromatium vinosum (strain ATCC 17899 / DSM 180 / NBRC 103801 / NCIMB 10441 / D) TaxID=572477 RepID=D3RRP9_ALLVD|nr:hypothetical protein [Allochromatium vinosum]ADC61953.1 conserved hypothetical protein [Allochromatium vinosum DSM 180]